MIGSCQGSSEPSSARQVEAIDDPNSPSAMIQIPLLEDGRIDSSKIAVLDFMQTEIDFGTVDEGETVTRVFPFVNSGAVALILYDASSSCGCTVPEIPQAPIAPGDTSELLVSFNTAQKTGDQVKAVTVQANTFPPRTKVILRGRVNPKS